MAHDSFFNLSKYNDWKIVVNLFFLLSTFQLSIQVFLFECSKCAWAGVA